ncbi:CheY-like chemotaxis protein [Allocatelliglobosispora scoriae]|uniref:CheY-like chemotaxis protein n=1 Tax=Allocatelliglobosispora scoriae TaxID=643052 RepID=A0A841BJK8_9ACTN|nr:response regulator [Allocatelliglobosispora scoriae]MBB5867815.1 CheY-like chemotaxis protein [Allocatelliglobosispora scoriae]
MIDEPSGAIAEPGTRAAAVLTELVDRLADPDDPHPQQALDRLAVLFEVQTAVGMHIRQAAADAAAAGANYAQIGAACRMTRQGARRRWPGLVFARPAHTSAEGADPVIADLTHTYTVLLIEDDDADAMLIEEALIEHGMTRTVHRADDGISALEFLRDDTSPRPDLIVLDLNMPRMNGREVLAVLKHDPSLSTIPVVVLTTSTAPDDINGAYREHANAYVTKPVSLDDFLSTVQSIDAFFLSTATPPSAAGAEPGRQEER